MTSSVLCVLFLYAAKRCMDVSGGASGGECLASWGDEVASGSDAGERGLASFGEPEVAELSGWASDGPSNDGGPLRDGDSHHEVAAACPRTCIA
eukprot:809189-Pyramimonas_sp.AAC.1